MPGDPRRRAGGHAERLNRDRPAAQWVVGDHHRGVEGNGVSRPLAARATDQPTGRTSICRSGRPGARRRSSPSPSRSSTWASRGACGTNGHRCNVTRAAPVSIFQVRRPRRRCGESHRRGRLARRSPCGPPPRRCGCGRRERAAHYRGWAGTAAPPASPDPGGAHPGRRTALARAHCDTSGAQAAAARHASAGPSAATKGRNPDGPAPWGCMPTRCSMASATGMRARFSWRCVRTSASDARPRVGMALPCLQPAEAGHACGFPLSGPRWPPTRTAVVRVLERRGRLVCLRTPNEPAPGRGRAGSLRKEGSGPSPWEGTYSARNAL